MGLTLERVFLIALFCTLCCATEPSSSNRTVIFVYYVSQPDEDVFIRGGISDSPDCTADFDTDPCKIPIRTHLLGTISTYDKYNSWRVNDSYLDWFGAEPNQGTYEGTAAEGTPLAWTTNNPLSTNYQELNQYGDNYWMVDMEMDCSSTDSGWFEFKAYITSTGWEGDITQEPCAGTVGGTASITTTNHMGICGNINTFSYGNGSCIIDAFTE